MPETGIQQVQRGMFHTAVVPVDVHPVVKRFFGSKFPVVVRITVTQEIPGRTRPVRHHVGFPPRFAAAFRTSGVNPVESLGQRRFAFVVRMIVRHLRQFERQLRFGNRLPAAVFAVNHRDRFAPVTLAGEYPVAQLEVHFGAAETVFHRMVDRRPHAVFLVHAV